MGGGQIPWSGGGHGTERWQSHHNCDRITLETVTMRWEGKLSVREGSGGGGHGDGCNRGG